VQAHEAHTLLLRAKSRGVIPPSLSIFRARLAPLISLDADAGLTFSDPLYDQLTEHDLSQYTIGRPKQASTTKIDQIRKQHEQWVSATLDDTPKRAQSQREPH